MSAAASGTPLEAWSDQDPCVAEHLQRGGRWQADGRRVPYAVRPAFKWMRRQMRERVEGATGRPLVWLTVVPTVRREELCDWSCTGASGEVCDRTHVTPGKTLLQVRIPVERVLLSDFGLWDRHVLRYEYVPTDDDDAARWERELRRALGVRRDDPVLDPSSTWPKRLVDRLIASWDRIFDVAPGRPTQGTIEQLDPADVVNMLSAPGVDGTPSWLHEESWTTYRRGGVIARGGRPGGR